MAPAASASRFLHYLGQLPTRRRLALAVGAGALAALLAPAVLSVMARAIVGWDAFALTTLVLIWISITTTDGYRIRNVATAEDPGRTLSFVFVLVGAVSSLLAVGVLLRIMHQGQAHQAVPGEELLAIVAVAGAWLLLHTLFTLRYAHLYYAADVDGGEGGLEFPGAEKEPDYLDFAYFSFVIGMTAQTADISISGRTLRRMALLHGVLAYVFNTAVIALTISSLASVL